MNLEIIPLAQRDLDEVAKYYASQREGLDDEFLADVDAGVAAIAARPWQFEQFRPGIRRYLLDRFPYGIYCRMPADDVVRIILVKHRSRHPGFGMRRK